MAQYWITFRLKNNLDYTRRYRAFTDAIKQAGEMLWDEPTSFVAFESDASIDDIGQFLLTFIDPNVDIFVLRHHGHTTTVYGGKPDKAVMFRRYFASAKQL